jgi:hypothetical protein
MDNEMNLELLRFNDNNESTIGLLFLNGKFFCYTLEDEHRDIKVRGETRIPEGHYKLGLRKEDTPLTLSYRKKHTFFKYHIEVLNVPNFSGIYIHPGNNDAHTDGCILVGNNLNNNRKAKGLLSDSTTAWKELYEILYPLLEKGTEVKLWVNKYYNS